MHAARRHSGGLPGGRRRGRRLPRPHSGERLLQCRWPSHSVQVLEGSKSFSETFSALQASTKDGELVVRPKLTLGDSTNVGDLREFNSYRRSIVRLLPARSSGLMVYISSCAADWTQWKHPCR
jgi:hypothetical protein